MKAPKGAPPPLRVPVGIPIIGQGPAPEQVAQMVEEANLVFKTWPVHAYPTGPNAGSWWGGKTMLHTFAEKAMEVLGPQFSAKSRTDQELVTLCQKAWKIAILMQRTAPFSTQEEKKQDAPIPTAEPTRNGHSASDDADAPTGVGRPHADE